MSMLRAFPDATVQGTPDPLGADVARDHTRPSGDAADTLRRMFAGGLSKEQAAVVRGSAGGRDE